MNTDGNYIAFLFSLHLESPPSLSVSALNSGEPSGITSKQFRISQSKKRQANSTNCANVMPVFLITLAIYNWQNDVSGKAVPVEDKQICCWIVQQFVSLDLA